MAQILAPTTNFVTNEEPTALVVGVSKKRNRRIYQSEFRKKESDF